MLNNTWRGLIPGTSTSGNVLSVLGPPDRESEGITYGSVEGLRLMDYGNLRASVILRGGQVFVIVLVPKDGGEFPTQIRDWESALGKPDRKLPSIRGKNHRVYVYSSKGLTATVEGIRVRRVELFPPMSPDEYEHSIYQKPPVFVK